jgi:two-component system LytT family response regulator
MGRILIVDGDSETRLRMRELARSRGDVSAIAEAADGVSAVVGIQSFKPTVVFLGVDLPRLSGFEVLYNIEQFGFSTVFHLDQCSPMLRVFANGTHNSLVKPFSDACWHDALTRATEASGVAERDFNTLKQQLHGEGLFLERIVVCSRRKTHLLRAETISHFTSQEHITFVHTHESSLGYDKSLAFLEKRLDPKRFSRMHRNAIVNLDAVVSFPIGKSDTMVLRNGAVLRVSRTKRRSLKRNTGRIQRN